MEGKVARFGRQLACTIVLLVVGLFSYGAPVKAGVGINPQISFQGKLTNADGTNVANDTYTMVFRIYAAASGGVAVWTETQSITTSAGLFHANLGAVTTLPGSVDFNSDSLYFTIEVNSDGEMGPDRIRLTAVPYAFNADLWDGYQFADYLNQAVKTTSSPTFANLTDSGLTSGRVVYAGTAGILQDSSNLNFNGSTLGLGAASNASYGLYTDQAFNSASTTAAITGRNTAGASTTGDLIGLLGISNKPNGTDATLTNAIAIKASSLWGTTGTLSNSYKFYGANDTGGGTITTQYGLYLEDMTAGASDYGIAIAGADTAALWLGSGADNTDAANGIMFGSSKDTDLYRSAANTLKTDGSFLAANLTDSGLTSGRVTYAGTAGILQDSANMTFDGTTLGVTGLNLNLSQDYTFSDRSGYLALQAQTSGSSSQFELYAKDGDGTDGVANLIFGVGTPADISNAEYGVFEYNVAASAYTLRTQKAGTGTVRPLKLYTGANTSQLVLNIDGTTSFGAGITATAVTDSGLTAGRVTYAGTAGILQDSANLTFNGTMQTISGTSAGASIGLLSALNASTDNLSASTIIMGASATRGSTIADIASGTNGAGRHDLVLSTSGAASPAEYMRLNYGGQLQVLATSGIASNGMSQVAGATTRLDVGGGNLNVWNTTTLGSEVHIQSNAAADPNGTETNATTGWTGVTGTLTSVDVADTAPQTGTYSLKMVSAGGASRAEYAYTAKVGAMYKISIWAKRGSQGTAQDFHTWVGLGNLLPTSAVLVSSTTWTEYVFYQTATATAATIRAYVQGNTGDILYLDNVSIKEVNSGDVIARGLFTGGGSSGLDIDAVGNLAADKALNLGSSNFLANSNNLYFDGVSDFAAPAVGSWAELNSTANFSWSSWINFDDITATHYMFVKSASSTNRILILQQTSRFYVYVNNGSSPNAYFTLTGAVANNEWHHYAVVYDGSAGTDATKLVIYLDGVAQTLVFSASPPATTGDMSSATGRISESSGTVAMLGYLKDWRLYDASLSAANVLSVFQGSSSVSGMVHRYKINEGTGSPLLLDSGSNPQNATLTGGTWTSKAYTGIGLDAPISAISLLAGTTANEGIRFGNDTQLYRTGQAALMTNANLTVANLTDSGLTATRVVYAGTAGILQDSANMTFDATNGLAISAVTNRLSVGAAVSTTIGTYIRPTFTDTATNVIGLDVDSTVNDSNTAYYGLVSRVSIANTKTVTTNYGEYLYNPIGSGAVTNNYGIFVEDQTKGGTADYGITIAGADTLALWISSGADNTDAANGLAFGLSKDTDLYRSAADFLRTDDSFATPYLQLNSAVTTGKIAESAYTFSATSGTTYAKRDVYGVTASVTSSGTYVGNYLSLSPSQASTSITSVIGAQDVISLTGNTGVAVTTVIGREISIPTANAGADRYGTIYGLNVKGNLGTSQLTGNFAALHVENIITGTGNTKGYGLMVDGASGANLWLSATADATTSVGGILFGLSQDTDLYRSAANILYTDDSFTVGTNLTVAGTSALQGATTESKVNAASGSADALTLSGTLGIFNGSDTFRGLYLNYTNANHTGSSNVFNGIDIANITGDAEATETAINVGTGWDYGVTLGLGGTASLNLSSTAGTAAGGILFGADTSLYRSATNTLATGDAVNVGSSNFLGNANKLYFDGNGDYVSLTAGNWGELDSASAFTLSSWINLDDITQTKYLFVKSLDGTHRVLVYTNASRLYTEVSDGSTATGYFTLTGAVANGTYRHISVVYDGTQSTNATRLVVYLDGVAQTLTFSGTIPATTANMAAGTSNTISNTGTASMLGYISDFRIYSTALSSANVASVFQGSTSVSNMVHRYKLDDGTGVTAIVDSGTNAQNGTLTGGTWTSKPLTGIGIDTPVSALDLLAGTTPDQGIRFGHDTDLYRGAANELRTDDIFSFSAKTTTDIDFKTYKSVSTASGVAFIFDTSATVSTGSLFSVRNNGTAKFGINNDGNVVATGSFTTGTPVDIAENISTIDPTITAGDVVMADPNHPESIVKTSEHDTPLGVISTEPGVLMGGGRDGKPIALAGRVPVKVVDTNGLIHAGDVVIPAPTPGTGMRAGETGAAMIGVALQDQTTANDTIVVFMKLGSYIPNLGSYTASSALTPQQQNILSSFTILDNNLLQVDALQVEHLTVNAELTVNGMVIADGLSLSDRSAGRAALPAGDTTVFVTTNSVTATDQILITPIMPDTVAPIGVNLYRGTITPGVGFEVQLVPGEPLPYAQPFDWLIIH